MIWFRGALAFLGMWGQGPGLQAGTWSETAEDLGGVRRRGERRGGGQVGGGGRGRGWNTDQRLGIGSGRPGPKGPGDGARGQGLGHGPGCAPAGTLPASAATA